MDPMSSSEDIAANMPNASMMQNAYTPVFGNLGFQLAPSQTGEINYSFGRMPYFSLEGVLYLQQMNAATNPANILPGQHTGQQNINGQITVTGAAGNQQVAIGSATSDSGSF